MRCGVTLDGVGAGLVHGFAGGDVGGDLFIVNREEFDGGDFGGDLGAGGGDDRDPGNDAVRAAAEAAQHARGVRGVFGLCEDLAVDSDGGVGAEHRRRAAGDVLIGEHAVDGFGLLAREAGDVGDGILAWADVFRDVGRGDVEPEARLRQELSAARRGGGQNQSHEFMFASGARGPAPAVRLSALARGRERLGFAGTG